MAPTPGTRIGLYETIGATPAGGMGEGFMLRRGANGGKLRAAANSTELKQILAAGGGR